jgi:hypothetical protein
MVSKPQGVASFPQTQSLGVPKKGHEALRLIWKATVPPGREPGPLGLAGEEREFGHTAVGGKHQGTLGIGGPRFGAGHWLQAERLARPPGSFGPIRDEELDMVNAKRGEGRVRHAPAVPP